MDISEALMEGHYKLVPHRIVIEHLILDEQGESPSDIKFFTFHGKVKMLYVDTRRPTYALRNYFTADWRELGVSVDTRYQRSPASRRNTDPMPPPQNLAELVAVAEKLAAPFPFARVDLYDVGGKVYFGEITHTPGGASARYTPREFDRVLGKIWREGGGEIPAKYFYDPATA